MGRLVHGWSAVLTALCAVLLLSSLPPSASEKVTVSVYYEALCPFCANFVVYHLVKLFENGLISAVNLRMIPWGNAWIQPDGSFFCQHGPDECMLNTIEACTISIYPDIEKHFRFIHCVEGLTVQNRHNEWTKCFDIAKLSAIPIDCYRNGHGKMLEQYYASETTRLNPPHRFVPWVIVDNHPLQEDYQNFMAYICKAYKGSGVPEACKSINLDNRQYLENASGGSQVCYATTTRNSTL
ncbi:gamma-interferon-inducible lysosomal thiol reductase [Cucumis melo var. makuwa]|uniref:Gamma-interferon-inducible lysosomal thiol reductase n=2 Tax=Cucumis melo TaxID=3656 RepID=A0A5D3CGA6_CUCMM|nr:gamma-interferon-responsive lysosomal thiol protein [Cucumis melo]TYK10933.1 gamma-interferon-inducible lysosomal thiol reductase [Cucumis melo var. makuwa]